jgi:hypothetical protein
MMLQLNSSFSSDFSHRFQKYLCFTTDFTKTDSTKNSTFISSNLQIYHKFEHIKMIYFFEIHEITVKSLIPIFFCFLDSQLQ